MAIKIFLADSMQYTFFSPEDVWNTKLIERGIAFVDSPTNADIIVARKIPALIAFGHYNRHFAIWTHEPSYDYHLTNEVLEPCIMNPVHIMNAYGGQIYADKFYYFEAAQLDFDKMIRVFSEKPRSAAMLASYRRPAGILVDGRNLDLNEYRLLLGVFLHARGFCDLYGRDWPREIRISGESRTGKWKVTKQHILKSYSFNITLENTIIKNYVTEKIWEAIIAGCLPVYHGSENGVYDIFPANSFVEVDGKSMEQLVDEIMSMPREVMLERYEACLRSYMAINAKDLKRTSRAACLDRTVQFLKRILDEDMRGGRVRRYLSSNWIRSFVKTEHE